MPNKPGELIKYIRYDGEVINLHSPPSRAVANMTGWGYPPRSIHRIKGAFQHGASVLGYRFQPRDISMDIISPNCSRSDWFTERSNLIEKLGLHTTNPNLPLLGRLQWEYVHNGEIKKRALDCYLNQGLEYSPDPQWWQTGILESLKFIAEDPIIYDPDQVTVTITGYEEELTLPVTFPFILGSKVATQNITYDGTWFDFPIIEVDGPTNGVYIENTTLGLFIRLDYAITSGVTVTFDLREGFKTIKDSNDNNLIQYLSSDSNLSQFAIERDPFATDGVNSIYVVLTDYDSNSAVRLKYYSRYIGI